MKRLNSSVLPTRTTLPLQKKIKSTCSGNGGCDVSDRDINSQILALDIRPPPVSNLLCGDILYGVRQLIQKQKFFPNSVFTYRKGFKMTGCSI